MYDSVIRGIKSHPVTSCSSATSNLFHVYFMNFDHSCIFMPNVAPDVSAYTVKNDRLFFVIFRRSSKKSPLFPVLYQRNIPWFSYRYMLRIYLCVNSWLETELCCTLSNFNCHFFLQSCKDIFLVFWEVFLLCKMKPQNWRVECTIQTQNVFKSFFSQGHKNSGMCGKVLSLSSIYTHFNTLKKKALGKHCRKKWNCSIWAITPSFQNGTVSKWCIRELINPLPDNKF